MCGGTWDSTGSTTKRGQRRIVRLCPRDGLSRHSKIYILPPFTRTHPPALFRTWLARPGSGADGGRVGPCASWVSRASAPRVWSPPLGVGRQPGACASSSFIVFWPSARWLSGSPDHLQLSLGDDTGNGAYKSFVGAPFLSPEIARTATSPRSHRTAKSQALHLPLRLPLICSHHPSP